MKDKAAEALGLPNITYKELEDEIHGPKIIKSYRKFSIEMNQTYGFYIPLEKDLRSPFRDFESYLRFLTVINEDDIQLILKQYNLKFETYKIAPGVYTFKDLSIVHSRGL